MHEIETGDLRPARNSAPGFLFLFAEPTHVPQPLQNIVVPAKAGTQQSLAPVVDQSVTADWITRLRA
jgi:hypothetical protein